jgi:glutathione S-transferase
MTTIKLYGPRGGSSVRTHWVAAELGTPYEAVAVDFAKGENRSDWFLRINPMGQVPAMVTDDFNRAESMAIGSFLIDQAGSGSDLGGKTAQERATAWQWSLWAAFNPQPALVTLAAPLWTKQPLAPEAESAAKATAAKYLALLDAHLARRPFIAGAAFTVGDINVASSLAYAAMSGFDLSAFPKVTTWLAKVTARPAYLRATGAPAA